MKYIKKWKYFWNKMHFAAKISCIGMLLLYTITLSAPVLAPYSYAKQHRRHPHCPPTKIHFFTKEGQFVRPYVNRYRIIDGQRRLYKEIIGGKRYPIKFWKNGKFFAVDKEAVILLLGADALGRDIFSRLLYGGRVSMNIPLAGVFVSLFLGLLIGSASGYFGGAVDNIIMTICLIIMSVPRFPLLLVLAGTIPAGVSSTTTLTMIVAIMSLVGWAGMARTIRGMTASVREREFVMAARSLGGSHWRIITKHVMPATFNYAIVGASMSVPGFIMGESGLSLLGLGVQEPQASWGNMLSEAMKNVQILSKQPTLLIPGLMILITVMCFNFFGDFLRDFFDPRTRRSL